MTATATKVEEPLVEGPPRPVLRAGWFEVVTVGYVLACLVMIVFWSHLAGSGVPPLDFLGHYNTDTFAWWRDGGFFDPPQWMAYMYGGYPSVMDVQNSSFYLPVGIVAETFQFDLRASAVVSTMHVAFGALGMYVMARRLGMSMPVSFVGLVVWFFIGPFFSNAQHLDIMRSYAWLPWILLILSPRWPWRQWWAIGVAGLILWQGVLSMYPGVLIAGIYALPLWVVGMQLAFRSRPRDFLVPAVISTAAAGLMVLLRYLPFVVIRGGTASPRGYDSSEWSWGFLATTLYPYDIPTLPNDIPFRSFFIGATVLAALTITSWRHRMTLVALPMVVVAVVLGVPTWPWSPAVRLLPGLDISRFLMSDFKPYLLAALVVIALVALHEVSQTRAGPESPWAVVRVGGVMVAVAVALGWTGDYSARVWVTQWVLLAVALAAVVGLVRATSRLVTMWLITGLALIAAVSGIVAVRSTTQTWDVDRASAEAVYGAPVDVLISRRADPDAVLVGRPQRVPPRQPVDIYAVLAPWQNRVHYEGGFSVAGYITMAGSGAYDKVVVNLIDSNTGPAALAFWSAPGIGLTSDDTSIPSPARVGECADTGRCGPGVTVTPVSFQASGTIVYTVTADKAATMLFNEAYYPGWSATACPIGGEECVAVPVSTGNGGQIVAAMPAGDWLVTLTYAMPGQRASWVLFWIGAVTLLLSAAVGALGRSKWRASGPKGPESRPFHLPSARWAADRAQASASAAWAWAARTATRPASRRATGTRKGEHET